MTTRRSFIKKASLGGLAIAGMSSFTIPLARNRRQLIILHTNDMHSRIEPFPGDHPKYPDLGGMARRAQVIKNIREQNKDKVVLVLDSGDVFQGTPYFNMYGGALEFKLMSAMGYDACTMGNHDFDNGIEGFLKMLPHAKFPFVCSNYNFEHTALKGKTKPYHIIDKQDMRIGIIGLGVQLEGLVDPKNYGNTIYESPVERANYYASLLKKNERCDFVICLSHLGYSYEHDKISDVTLAPQTRYIDMILGGHTHTFLDKPEVHKNLDQENVIINQVGWAGINLGRIDVKFRGKRKKEISAHAPIDLKKNYAKV